MEIKSIYIDGLHNAVNKTYEFGDIVYLIGRNGAGKSTVLQAIQFALLGYIPGTAKNSKEAILRHSPKSDITVKLELDDVSITRRINKSVNQVTVNPDGYDIASITKELELPIFNFNEFVGQTANKLKEYFIKNILPTSDGNLDWQRILEGSVADCNFTDRDSIMEYGLSLVDGLDGDVLEQVVNANAKFKEEQSFNKSELQRLQNTVDSLIYYDDYTGPTDIDVLNSKITSLNILRDHVIKYNAASEATKSAEDELSVLEARLDMLGGKLAYDKVNDTLAQLKRSQIVISEKITSKNDEIVAYRTSDNISASIINSGGVCPYTKDVCKSITSRIDTLRNESVTRKAELLEAKAELENYTNDLNDVQRNIRECESAILDFNNIWNRIELLKKTLIELPIKPDTDKSAIELASEIDRLSEDKAKLQANIRYNETIENITNLKFEAELRGEALAKWTKATDTNGLQTTLMVKPFEELAEGMTEYIQRMYGNSDLKAHFNISTKANSFSFGLVRDGVYIPYDLLSSGEKCLYALALMICITNNTKSPLKLMLCDDMFDHLDSATIENTFSTLKGISDIQFIFAGVNNCNSASDVIINVK